MTRAKNQCKFKASKNLKTMKLEISSKELQDLRKILWEGRAHERTEMVKIVDKLIRKINAALKETHGHDCCGDRYL